MIDYIRLITYSTEERQTLEGVYIERGAKETQKDLDTWGQCRDTVKYSPFEPCSHSKHVD